MNKTAARACYDAGINISELIEYHGKSKNGGPLLNRPTLDNWSRDKPALLNTLIIGYIQQTRI